MKKNLKKLLAVILCMALCLSVTVFNLSVTADPDPGEVNVLSGLIPVQFSAAGSFANIKNYNDRQLRCFPAGSGQYRDGYSPANTDTKSTWSDYLANMTDSDDSTGTGFQGASNGDTDYKVIVYFLEQKVDVHSFTVKTSGQNTKTADVYISDSYATVFDEGSKVFTGSNGSTVTASDINKSGYYFAFLSKGDAYTINEIEVYGSPVESLIDGQAPIVFAAATGLGNVQDYNFNTTLRYWGVSNEYKSGYTPTDQTTKSQWIDDRENTASLSEHRLSHLTDNDTSTYMGLQPLYSGQWTVVAYQFNPATISSLSIVSEEKNDYSERIVVYVSDSYDTLLTTESIIYGGDSDQKSWATQINIDSINKKGSYIAIATKERGFSIKEIDVYGEVEQQTAEGTNLISGQFPIVFAAATGLGNVQDYNFNTTLRYWGVSNEYKSGYTPTDQTTKSQWIDDRENTASLSEHRLSHLTDNDPSTYMGLQPLYSGYWTVVAYQFNPATISKLSILSQEKNDYSQRIVVYVSNSYNSLLTTENIVYGGDSDQKSWATEINIDSINKEGSYIAIATKERGFSIREIAVYGEEIVEEDINAGYNDILTTGQLPVQFNAASNLSKISIYNDRELRYFPVTNAWYNGYTPNNTETKDTWSGQLALLTDDDAETGMPMRSRYEDNYTAIVYGFSTAKIKGFSIEVDGANEKLINVYVSNSYSDLFDEGSKIFSGNTSSNIKNTATLNAVGSYIAFVTQDRDVTIKEISVYGEWLDLIKGKTPVALYPVYDNTEKYAFANVKVGSAETNYRYGLAKPEDPTQCVDEIKKLTDADDTTYATFKNEANIDENGDPGHAQDIALVYKFDNNSNVSSIALSGVSGENKIGGAKFYLSRSYAGLFNVNNFAGEYGGGGYHAALDVDADNNTLYVGIIIRIISENYKSIKLSNISILGESIEKEADYGDTLTGTSGPVNPNANEATKMFYEYLKYVGNSENILLGAHINLEADTLAQAGNEDNYYDYLARKTGLTPSIYSTRISTQSIESYVECYEQGSVPIIMCLYASKLPTFQALLEAGDDSSINYMVKYLDKTYTPSSSEMATANQANAEFWDSVEDAADFFEALEAAGVETYIVSPFNEMNMYGFYGNKNHTEIIDRFINVWRQVYDYFVNTRQLKGILFALRPTGTHADGGYRTTPYRYYPGDNYVDIIAPTLYSKTDDGVLDTFTGYGDFVSTGKVIGLSETGPLSASNVSATADCLNLLNSLKTTYSDAAFAALWYGYRFDILQHDNHTEFLNDDYILTVESMHDYRHFNVPEFIGNAPDDVMNRKISLISSAVKTVKFDSSGDFQLAVARDMSEARMIELDVYVSNSAISTLSLKLESAAGSATYSFSGIANGWNHLAVRIDDTSATEGTINYSSITGYTLTGTANAKIYVANLYAANYIDGDANRDDTFDIRDLVRTKKLFAGITDSGNKLAVSGVNYTIDLNDFGTVRSGLLTLSY